MAKALLIVDMLNDFVEEDGALPVPGAKDIVENIGRIKGTAGEYGVLVAYANDAHEKDDPEFENWPPHAIKGTYGAQVIDDLAVTDGDTVIEKQDLSMFTNPRADYLLKYDLIDELYIAGVATEYCVRGAALDAIAKGYKVNLVVDAIAGVDEIKLPDGNVVPETKGAVNRALLEMGNAGAKPMYTAQVLKEMIE